MKDTTPANRPSGEVFECIAKEVRAAINAESGSVTKIPAPRRSGKTTAILDAIAENVWGNLNNGVIYLSPHDQDILLSRIIARLESSHPGCVVTHEQLYSTTIIRARALDGAVTSAIALMPHTMENLTTPGALRYAFGLVFVEHAESFPVGEEMLRKLAPRTGAVGIVVG